MTEEDSIESESYGYDVITNMPVEEWMKELWEWWKLSCSLKFITEVKNRNFEDIISQFEYEEN